MPAGEEIDPSIRIVAEQINENLSNTIPELVLSLLGLQEKDVAPPSIVKDGVSGLAKTAQVLGTIALDLAEEQYNDFPAIRADIVDEAQGVLSSASKVLQSSELLGRGNLRAGYSVLMESTKVIARNCIRLLSIVYGAQFRKMVCLSDLVVSSAHAIDPASARSDPQAFASKVGDVVGSSGELVDSLREAAQDEELPLRKEALEGASNGIEESNNRLIPAANAYLQDLNSNSKLQAVASEIQNLVSAAETAASPAKEGYSDAQCRSIDQASKSGSSVRPTGFSKLVTSQREALLKLQAAVDSNNGKGAVASIKDITGCMPRLKEEALAIAKDIDESATDLIEKAFKESETKIPPLIRSTKLCLQQPTNAEAHQQFSSCMTVALNLLASLEEAVNTAVLAATEAAGRNETAAGLVEGARGVAESAVQRRPKEVVVAAEQSLNHLGELVRVAEEKIALCDIVSPRVQMAAVALEAEFVSLLRNTLNHLTSSSPAEPVLAASHSTGWAAEELVGLLDTDSFTACLSNGELLFQAVRDIVKAASIGDAYQLKVAAAAIRTNGSQLANSAGTAASRIQDTKMQAVASAHVASLSKLVERVAGQGEALSHLGTDAAEVARRELLTSSELLKDKIDAVLASTKAPAFNSLRMTVADVHSITSAAYSKDTPKLIKACRAALRDVQPLMSALRLEMASPASSNDQKEACRTAVAQLEETFPALISSALQSLENGNPREAEAAAKDVLTALKLAGSSLNPRAGSSSSYEGLPNEELEFLRNFLGNAEKAVLSISLSARKALEGDASALSEAYALAASTEAKLTESLVATQDYTSPLVRLLADTRALGRRYRKLVEGALFAKKEQVLEAARMLVTEQKVWSEAVSGCAEHVPQPDVLQSSVDLLDPLLRNVISNAKAVLCQPEDSIVRRDLLRGEAAALCALEAIIESVCSACEVSLFSQCEELQKQVSSMRSALLYNDPEQLDSLHTELQRKGKAVLSSAEGLLENLGDATLRGAEAIFYSLQGALVGLKDSTVQYFATPDSKAALETVEKWLSETDQAVSALVVRFRAEEASIAEQARVSLALTVATAEAGKDPLPLATTSQQLLRRLGLLASAHAQERTTDPGTRQILEAAIREIAEHTPSLMAAAEECTFDPTSTKSRQRVRDASAGMLAALADISAAATGTPSGPAAAIAAGRRAVEALLDAAKNKDDQTAFQALSSLDAAVNELGRANVLEAEVELLKQLVVEAKEVTSRLETDPEASGVLQTLAQRMREPFFRLRNALAPARSRMALALSQAEELCEVLRRISTQEVTAAAAAPVCDVLLRTVKAFSHPKVFSPEISSKVLGLVQKMEALAAASSSAAAPARRARGINEGRKLLSRIREVPEPKPPASEVVPKAGTTDVVEVPRINATKDVEQRPPGKDPDLEAALRDVAQNILTAMARHQASEGTRVQSVQETVSATQPHQETPLSVPPEPPVSKVSLPLDALPIAEHLRALADAARRGERAQFLIEARAIAGKVNEFVVELRKLSDECRSPHFKDRMLRTVQALKNFSVQLKIMAAVKAGSQDSGPDANEQLIFIAQSIGSEVTSGLDYMDIVNKAGLAKK